jgi:predicted esterase
MRNSVLRNEWNTMTLLTKLFLVIVLLGVLAAVSPSPARSQPPMTHATLTHWPSTVRAALAKAGPNRAQLLDALNRSPENERAGVEFLIANMPPTDLVRLTSDYLLAQTALAYAAYDQSPWKAAIPQEIFLNNILPYACLNEARDSSRAGLRAKCLPLVAGCQTPGDAALRLNAALFPLVHVHYSTERQRPDQNPTQTMASGLASCTGLSILLTDACRAVGVPARLAGTPLWANNSGNHTWVEVWDAGGWHFLGASEPDSHGLDHAWFTGNASQASNPDHPIFASSFQKTGVSFPLVWAPDITWVPAVNVTARYAAPVVLAAGECRLLVKVLDPNGKRVTAQVVVQDHAAPGTRWVGISKGETADMNNVLTFPVPEGASLRVTAYFQDQMATEDYTPNAKDTEQTVTLKLTAKSAKKVSSQPEKPLTSATKMRLQTALKGYFHASPTAQAHWKFSQSLQNLLLQNEPAVRAIAWEAYKAADIHAKMKSDFAAKQVTFETYLSPYTLKYVGTRPAHGWPLFIAMHGGGGAPKAVNDEQWQEMQIYYKDHPEVGGYEYLALRAPNDTWNGFYDVYVYPLIHNLVQQFLLYGDVDPNKVFLMGYSHGGYGAFAIGPKEPDLFACIHASAAAPTGGETTPVTLRHTVFGCMVGTEDTMYDRYPRDQKFESEIAALRGSRTDIYPVTVDFMEGYHHSDLPDRDLIPSMYPSVRNPVPHDLTWLMTDAVITDFFWLHTDKPGKTEEIDANCVNNHVTVTTTSNVADATVLLDSRLVDFRHPITLTVNGHTTTMHVQPSLQTLCETLRQRGDPDRAFTAAVPLALPPAK